MSDSAAEEHDILPPGKNVGQYQICSFLTSGGMGEVYRATDNRIRRDVALKILPETYGENRERIRRFELEVQATGQLNHPNIVSIFDAGQFEGRPYIVTELLEGETLRSYIRSRSPLPIPEVISFATQICRGLAAAHDKGIIHRDLKPANIFVLKDHRLKILDFGLAKLTRSEWESGHHDDDDTLSGLSVPGKILGSVGYMSPEQVEARPLDPRSDIFALGSILYEMLTGERAFHGTSSAATISAILKDDPVDVRELRPETPAPLAVIVRRCLKKSPNDRFQTARDLEFSLDELLWSSDSLASGGSSPMLRGLLPAPGRRAGVWLTVLALLVTASIAVTILSRSFGASVERTVAIPSPSAPELVRLTASGRAQSSAALSPDAQYVVYARRAEDEEILTLMHIPTRSTTELERGYFPDVAFSPDGNFIYLIRYRDEESTLERLPLLGGHPTVITNSVDAMAVSSNGSEIAWVRHDEDGGTSSLFIGSSDGNTERKVVTIPWTEMSIDPCAWSPDGSRLICAAGNKELMIEIDVANGGYEILSHLPHLVSFEFSPDGSALIGPTNYANGYQIVRVDVETGATTHITTDPGQYPVMTLSGDGSSLAAIRLDNRINLWNFSLSNPDDLQAITSGSNTQDGNFGVNTAPDGRIVWSSRAAGKSIDLWVSEPDGSDPRRLTFDDGADEKWADVSPDGRTVAYLSHGRDERDIWTVSIDGGKPTRLTSTGDARAPRYTADGASLIFARTIGPEEYAFRMPASGGEIERINDRPASAPDPSPDGRWLLVTIYDKEGNHLELWPLEGDDEPQMLPIGGARQKKWRPDSRAFIYRGVNDLWMYVLDEKEPRKILALGPEDWIMAFAFTPDGNEIIISRRTDTSDLVLIRGIS